MDVEFKHLNQSAGNESFLIKFVEDTRGFGATHHPCLLVDSGHDVDLDSALADDEYLVGALLTHAHRDHYETLGQNVRDGADVYATPETAAALKVTYNEIENRLDNPEDTKTVINSLVEVDGWTDILDTVRVHPVPAGHAPGAAGFIVQFKGADGWETILCTGDFTTTRSGGYPSFETEFTTPPRCVFLTGASGNVGGEDYGGDDALTNALSTAAERAMAGATVLLTSSGLPAVEATYLLGHISDEYDLNVPITVTGHAASLYDALDYDAPNVISAPNFSRTDEVLMNGGITVATPQTPANETTAAGRLFDSIKDDTNAVLVQLTNGGDEPVDVGQCAVHAEERIAHPPEEEIDALVEELNPLELVITHATGRAARKYRDRYSSYVWAAGDTRWYTLYSDNGWLEPPWMTRDGRRHVSDGQQNASNLTLGEGDAPLPTVERWDNFDLEAEGLDPDAFESLKTSPTPEADLNGFADPVEAQPATSESTTEESAATATDGGSAVQTSATETTTARRPTTAGSLTAAENDGVRDVGRVADSKDESDNQSDDGLSVSQTASARAEVVDAGDGVVLLRPVGVDGDELTDALEVEHGDEVTLIMQSGGE